MPIIEFRKLEDKKESSQSDKQSLGEKQND